MNEYWYIWLVAAILFLAAEIIIPGFLVACFAVGALAGMSCSMLGLSISTQLMAFSIGVVIALVGIRPFVIKYLERDSEPMNANALIGQHALVTVDIEPLSGKGRVKVAGQDWKATSKDNTAIIEGRKVIVRAIDGAKLLVEQPPEE